MKKLLLLSGLMVAALGAYAQGTLTFVNAAPPAMDAPIFNNIPGAPQPNVRASGSSFQAQLYIGPAGTTSASALTTNGVSGTPASLQSGAAAGYFNGGVRDIAGTTAGTIITAQVRAWSTTGGATWETAGPNFRGESNLIQVTLGGGQTLPANLLGLQSFTVGIPEPSSIALGLLGLGAIVLFRRRK